MQDFENNTAPEMQENPTPNPETASNHDSSKDQSVGGEATTTNATHHQTGITEEDITAILAKNIPENPTFKNDNQPAQVDTDSIIDELANAADTLSIEKDLALQENQQMVSKIEALTSELEEAQNIASQVDELFKDIASQIPVLFEYAEAKVSGKEYEIPAQYIPEKFKRVEEHPIVGPLVASLLKGEEISPSEFVKALSDNRRSQLPADVPQSAPKTERVENKQSVPHSLLPGTSITIN